MIATGIAILSALAAVGSAIYAFMQAREARKQAEAARTSAKTARDSMLTEIVKECLESRRTTGQWQNVLDSHTELSTEERSEIDRRVRIHLGKS